MRKSWYDKFPQFNHLENSEEASKSLSEAIEQKKLIMLVARF